MEAVTGLAILYPPNAAMVGILSVLMISMFLPAILIPVWADFKTG